MANISPDANDGVRVSSADLSRNLSFWQEQALDRPVIITYHGRARLVLAPISVLDACGADCPKHRPNLPCDLELLREHLPQAFIAWDGQTRVREINRAAEVYIGAPRSAMLGKNFEEIFAAPSPRRSWTSSIACATARNAQSNTIRTFSEAGGL